MKGKRDSLRNNVEIALVVFDRFKDMKWGNQKMKKKIWHSGHEPLYSSNPGAYHVFISQEWLHFPLHRASLTIVAHGLFVHVWVELLHSWSMLSKFILVLCFLSLSSPQGALAALLTFKTLMPAPVAPGMSTKPLPATCFSLFISARGLERFCQYRRADDVCAPPGVMWIRASRCLHKNSKKC